MVTRQFIGFEVQTTEDWGNCYILPIGQVYDSVWCHCGGEWRGDRDGAEEGGIADCDL